MVDYRLKDLRGPSRRRFLKWFGAAGAAIGLERSKVLNVLLDSGGVAMADMCAAANRSVHLIGANGSLAWFQLLWPHLQIADPANAGMGFAYHAYNQGFLYTPTAGSGNQPFYYGPQAPWVVNGVPTRPVTGFMAGKDETHTPLPFSANAVGVNASMLGACAAIQAQSLSALVPTIALGPMSTVAFTGAGAPAVASVSSGADIVGLFDSVASTNALALQADKDLFDAYYKAFLGLRYAADLPTSSAQIANAKSAANLLGFNYGPQLTPTGPGPGTDTFRYGLDTLNASTNASAPQKNGFTALGMALIATAKALSIGLTNCVVMDMSPLGSNETQFADPHVAFSNTGGTITAGHLDSLIAFGTMLDAFYADLASVPDPVCTSRTLDKSVVFTAHGDTPKTPLVSSAWPDATPQASNWMYVMGNGYIKSGWFGGVNADGTVDTFDPLMGVPATPIPIGSQDISVRTYAAGAAVAYAVAQGGGTAGIDTVAPFYSGTTPYTGIIN
jgi:hypothetical protein